MRIECQGTAKTFQRGFMTLHVTQEIAQIIVRAGIIRARLHALIEGLQGLRQFAQTMQDNAQIDHRRPISWAERQRLAKQGMGVTIIASLQRRDTTHMPSDELARILRPNPLIGLPCFRDAPPLMQGQSFCKGSVH
jgi:hypothetical protein